MNKLGLAEAYCSFHGASKGIRPFDYKPFYGHELEYIAKVVMAANKFVSEEAMAAEFAEIGTIVYQRQEQAFAIEHLRFMKRHGKKVYCEFDDSLTGHPMKSVAKYWQTPERVKLYSAMCEEATGVIVTNETLADEFKRFNANVIVLPNSIDCSVYADARSDLSVGYAGSVGHRRDFKYLEYTLNKLAKKYPLRFMGYKPEGINAEYLGHPDIGEYPAKLSGAFSVGLAPLIRDDFSAKKTNIKWLEYSMSGIATVAEDFGAYKCIRHGEDGYLVNRDWDFHIENLMSSEEERERIVRNAQERIRREYSIENTVHNWAERL